jgi:hypothetical protein
LVFTTSVRNMLDYSPTHMPTVLWHVLDVNSTPLRQLYFLERVKRWLGIDGW